MTRISRRIGALIGGLMLGACAGLGTLDVQVSSFSQWPAGRAPGSYVFERLPSQQAQLQQQEQLEAAAGPALAEAGFTRAAEPARADVRVQLGAVSTEEAIAYWDDPAWGWGLGFGWPHHHSTYWGFGASWRYGPPYRYSTEVAVLIRDNATGQPLYETRARADATGRATNELLAGLYEAALKDFPQPAVNPRRVTVTLPR
jgi:hypothetical protein